MKLQQQDSVDFGFWFLLKNKQKITELKQLNNRKLVNTILYADDQILMATSEDGLQTMAYHLNLIARKHKMAISSTKTKSMAMWGTTYRG